VTDVSGEEHTAGKHNPGAATLDRHCNRRSAPRAAHRAGPMDGAMSTPPKSIVEMTGPAPVGRATTPIVLVEAE
jgi:hypothetical protein